MPKKKITETRTFVDEDGNSYEYKEEQTTRRYPVLYALFYVFIGVPFVITILVRYPWFWAVIVGLIILGLVGKAAEQKEVKYDSETESE